MYTRKGYAVQRSSLFYSFSTSFCPWYTFMVFHPFHCFQSYLFLQIFLPCSWTKVICDPVKCPITDSTLPRSTLHPLLLRLGIDIVKSWKTWRGKSRSWENFLQGKRLLRPVGLAVQFCECEFVSMINQEVVYEINALLPSVQKDQNLLLITNGLFRSTWCLWRRVTGGSDLWITWNRRREIWFLWRTISTWANCAGSTIVTLIFIFHPVYRCMHFKMCDNPDEFAPSAEDFIFWFVGALFFPS